jgi:Myb-like DNA-binding domain
MLKYIRSYATVELPTLAGRMEKPVVALETLYGNGQSLTKKNLGAYNWSQKHTLKLKEAIKLHGFDHKVIATSYFPETNPSIVNARMDTFRHLKLRSWSVEDEMAILNHLRSRFRDWKELAVKLNRSHQAVKNRYLFHVKPYLLRLRAQHPEKNLERLYAEYLSTLKRLLGEDDQGDLGKLHAPEQFTAEEDKKIEDLIQVLGPKWTMIGGEFPGRSPQSLKARYERNLARNEVEWTENELKILKESNVSHTEGNKLHSLRESHFPTRAVASLRTKLREVKAVTNEPLTKSEMHIIKHGVSKHGRAYFVLNANTELPNRTKKTLLERWAYLEPEEQPNAVWGAAEDDELLTLNEEYDRIIDVKANSTLLKLRYTTEMHARLMKLKKVRTLKRRPFILWTPDEDAHLLNVGQPNMTQKEWEKLIPDFDLHRSAYMCFQRYRDLTERRC